METNMKMKKWPIILAIVFVVVGAAAWIMQLQMGLLATSGMNNTFCWGLMIAIFAFLVGFGAGSQFVASYIVLAKRDDLRPYLKTAQAIALAGAVGAGVAILIDLGNPYHILAMIIGTNVTSPLAWDMVALTTFIIVAVINIIAIARESRALKVWMSIGALAALGLQLVEGLLFALMESRVWWHSFIMPIDFLIVAVVCGLALAVIICACQHDKFETSALRSLSYMLIAAIAIHLVLAVADFLIVFFEGNAASQAAIAAVVANWPLYAFELVLPLIAIFVLIAGGGQRKKQMLIGGILVVVGMFFHRLMLLYPALQAPTLFVPLSNMPSPSWAIPASTGLYTQTGMAFELAQGYVPNIFEWVSILLPIGAALLSFLIVLWFIKRFGPHA